jgi:hypothetical protein
MLSAHTTPEKIIVREGFPLFGYLGGFAEGYGVEVAEDAEADFTGEEGEWIDADDLREGFGEVG